MTVICSRCLFRRKTCDFHKNEPVLTPGYASFLNACSWVQFNRSISLSPPFSVFFFGGGGLWATFGCSQVCSAWARFTLVVVVVAVVGDVWAFHHGLSGSYPLAHLYNFLFANYQSLAAFSWNISYTLWISLLRLVALIHTEIASTFVYFWELYMGLCAPFRDEK